jgi:hypothetical protein
LNEIVEAAGLGEYFLEAAGSGLDADSPVVEGVELA